jgi:hypothetical protein
MKLNPKTLKLTFKIGDVVDISKADTAEQRLTQLIFKKLLFQYFHDLSSHSAGYGISFNGWLSFNGWEHLGLSKYKRVKKFS